MSIRPDTAITDWNRLIGNPVLNTHLWDLYKRQILGNKQ